MEKKIRKICFVITSKIHYARSKILLKELQKHPDVELQIVVGASAILPFMATFCRCWPEMASK